MIPSQNLVSRDTGRGSRVRALGARIVRPLVGTPPAARWRAVGVGGGPIHGDAGCPLTLAGPAMAVTPENGKPM